MELTEQQKTTITGWVKEGCGLSEIQRRLASEFGLRPTFMDVRFLILDLGLEIREKSTPRAAPKAAAPEVDAPMEDDAGEGFAEEAEDLPADGPGGVSVEVDRIMKPGALVSGTVTFSDGVKAAWTLDQYGRLALDAKQPGYRPSPEDIEGFQVALQKEVAKKGY
jgi:hypothetical protein